MTHDDAMALAAVKGLVASAAFGIVMGIVTAFVLSAAGLVRGRTSFLIVYVFIVLFCMSWAEFAQSLNFGRVFNPETAKAVGTVVAALAGLGIAWRVIERAPPTALLACFAILLGCGLTAVLALEARHENLVLLVVVVAIAAVVIIIAMLSLSFDRRLAREIEAPRYSFDNQLPGRDREPDRIARGITKLPAVRDKKGRWLT